MTRYPEIIEQLIRAGVITRAEADEELSYCNAQSALMAEGEISLAECERRIAEHAKKQAHVYLNRRLELPTEKTATEILVNILQGMTRPEP